MHVDELAVNICCVRPCLKGSTYTAGGVTYDFTGKNACDYLSDGKLKVGRCSFNR